MKNRKKIFEVTIFIILVAVGCIRAFANVAEMEKTSAAFAALNVSPAMKVFTAHNGYETFSPKFEIEFVSDKVRTFVQLTPELYRKLGGPYNRRNVYGAAISYGPVLVSQENTWPLFESVAKYSFCSPASLITELDLDVPQPIESIVLHYIHNEKSANDLYPSKLEVNCG